MSGSEDLIAAIEAKITSGDIFTDSVTYGDKQIKYRAMSDMMRMYEWLKTIEGMDTGKYQMFVKAVQKDA